MRGYGGQALACSTYRGRSMRFPFWQLIVNANRQREQRNVSRVRGIAVVRERGVRRAFPLSFLLSWDTLSAQGETAFTGTNP